MNLSPLAPLALLCAGATLALEASAQTFAGGSEKTAAQLETLSKKIDEQNLKIDALSQHILKLEKQIANIRPGVMIGENPTPAPSAPEPTPAPAGSENTHIVTKGETLTSIAKAHRVGVQELQKFNRIENDRALQIGQTILIPPTAGGSPAPTPAPDQ